MRPGFSYQNVNLLFFKIVILESFNIKMVCSTFDNRIDGGDVLPGFELDLKELRIS